MYFSFNRKCKIFSCPDKRKRLNVSKGMFYSSDLAPWVSRFLRKIQQISKSKKSRKTVMGSGGKTLLSEDPLHMDSVKTISFWAFPKCFSNFGNNKTFIDLTKFYSDYENYKTWCTKIQNTWSIKWIRRLNILNNIGHSTMSLPTLSLASNATVGSLAGFLLVHLYTLSNHVHFR